MKRWAGLAGVVVSFLLLAAAWAHVQGVADAQTIDELREDLDAKKESLKAVEDRIQKFKEDIQLKRHEARSLSDQIGIIEDSIEELSLSIERTVAEIEEVNAEIVTVENEITVKEGEITRQKELLGEYLRSLYTLNQQSSVAIFLKYATFSEAVTEAATYEELQNRSQQTLITIKQLRDELAQKKSDLEEFQLSLVALKQRQSQQQATLAVSKQSKERVLDLTQQQEGEYQKLLKEAQQAHQSAETEIKQLDEKIRAELSKQGKDILPSIGVLDWPIDAIFGVSCEFHCTGYPYAYLIGPHSGIDLPTNVGTPIKAPAAGYVARTHNANGPGYSYILLLHGDNVSTVYGHVSGFAVPEDTLVTRGTVIGYTGGAPGTNGAGLSSGPHLHFEVRVNNVPINPRNYL
jgi:murein DD-endopeptidase MepM/ murein hydrolase activator NlpD